MSFLPIIRAFNEHDVGYVVVGGVAVVLHGHPRLTGDLDLVVELSDANLLQALKLLTELGYQPRLPVKAEDFADAKKRESWVQEKGMKVFSLFNKLNPVIGVDLFAEYSIPYKQLFDNSVMKDLGSTEVRVCSIDDLILMKRGVSRPKDLEDIRVLEIIKSHE
jgi:hypothetical protein